MKIKIKDIKISDSFRKTLPNEKKMKEKWFYYRRTGNLMEDIIINEDNYLLDGYTSYLIARAEGIKEVDVIAQRRQFYVAENKAKIVIGLLLIIIGAISFGWFVGQLILMQMEVGG